MKKRLLNLMAIVMALGMVFMAAPVLAANGSTEESATMNGTVDWSHDWTVTDNGTPGTIFTQVLKDQYDAANGSELADLMVITALDSNSYFKITAKRGDWTLPSAYHATEGKEGADADTDFRIKVTNVAVGDAGATDNFELKNGFGVYKAITTADQLIAGGYDEERGYEGAGFDIDASILFDYDYDIKGAYALTFTMTLANATE